MKIARNIHIPTILKDMDDKRITNIEYLRMPDLKYHLGQLGEDTRGLKADLVARLKAAIPANTKVCFQ